MSALPSRQSIHARKTAPAELSEMDGEPCVDPGTSSPTRTFGVVHVAPRSEEVAKKIRKSPARIRPSGHAADTPPLGPAAKVGQQLDVDEETSLILTFAEKGGSATTAFQRTRAPKITRERAKTATARVPTIRVRTPLAASGRTSLPKAKVIECSVGGALRPPIVKGLGAVLESVEFVKSRLL